MTAIEFVLCDSRDHRRKIASDTPTISVRELYRLAGVNAEKHCIRRNGELMPLLSMASFVYVGEKDGRPAVFQVD